MDTRIANWLQDQHLSVQEFIPVQVRWNGDCLCLELARITEMLESHRAALESWLADLLGTAVVIAPFAWPPSSAEHLRALWTVTGSPLATLLPSDAITEESGRLICRFPSPLAQQLFQSWGGRDRVLRLWPDLPPLEVVVDEPPVHQADPVISIAAPESSGSVRLGRGLPKDPATPLDRVGSTGEYVVSGEVFARDVRVGRDGLKHVKLSLADPLGALRVRADERRGNAGFQVDELMLGQWIKVRGTMEMDKFTEESVLKIKDLGVLDPPRLDDGFPESRIELHAHSKMSAMDGLIEPKALFNLARQLGHPAVAMVDHGVVQTYPEAEVLAKKTGVRALYGVEVHMVEDEQCALSGPIRDSDGPFVVVDVETTGLSPRTHEVIEIGAVKIHHGQVVDRFHRLVRPHRSISRGTLEITGIRWEDLEDQPPPEVVWPDFFEFAEGSVLVAHNAVFDMGYLRAAWKVYGEGRDWPFSVIDTLTLARIRLPGLKSYGLGPLVRELHLTLQQHHRALDDADATGQLLLKLLANFEDGTAVDGEWLKASHPVSSSVGRPTPVVLFLRRQAGVSRLYEMISRSHLQTFHRVPRVLRSWIDDLRGDVLIGAPFHDGEMMQALYRGASEEEIGRIARFYDYWEVVPVEDGHSLLLDEHLGQEQSCRELVRDLIDLGDRWQKPVVAVSDAHYLRPRDRVIREVLAETAKGELHQGTTPLHFRTTGEMFAAFSWLPPEVGHRIILDAPKALVDQMETIKPVPDGLFAPRLEEAEEVISRYPFAKAHALYGDPLPQAVEERLNREIRSIVDHGFSSIYYIAHRLVKKSLQDGYLVGSRGSVGSSLVATLLDITEVNPLPPHYRCPQCRYSDFTVAGVGSGYDLPPKACPQCQTPLTGDGQDIPFETFLGFEGDKVPDIDLNFSGEYQSEIHRYAEELFGKGHVFRAGTIATVAAKTAFGLVKAWSRDRGRTPSPVEVDWMVDRLTGVKRTTGQHPGGLMVVPADEDILHFTPVQHPADDAKSDIVTTHFDYHAIEGRLLKLDLLGHDDPTAIRMLEELTGIAAQSVPFQDTATMSLFSGVDALEVTPEAIATPVGSLGIPEFGTRFVRGMLVDTRPGSFAELVRISGLSHGTEVWANNAQDLIRQGVANLSQVIATRDDIMSYLLERGLAPKIAFGISEGVRKGKGLNGEQEEAMRQLGVPAWYLDSCRKISYLFPKAHAAAYVMMGWRIAWFKVHHPLAFYATYFSVRAGDFEPELAIAGIKQVNQAIRELEEKGNEASAKERGLITVLEIMREMMARRLRFYPVDLMQSHATNFSALPDGLLIPFAALPGLGAGAAQAILTARSQGPFLSIADLRERAHLSKTVIDLLRRYGALDGLGETSQLAFF